MKDLQEKVDKLIEEFGGYWDPFKMLAALIEEVGELADALLAVEGVKGKKDTSKVEEELGDVLFALSCLANYYNINLSEALSKTVDKYRSRDSKRWVK